MSERPFRTGDLPPSPSLTRRRAAAALALAGAGAVASGSMASASSAAPPSSRRGPRLVAAERISARTVNLRIDSPALGRVGNAAVLLPPGYDDAPGRRWPVLYLLHGCCGSPGSTGWGNADAITARTPALVVIPEGGPAGFYSDWWNQGRYGAPAWETFHLNELRQILEQQVRAGDQRAVAGLSMGGHGALYYAGQHPTLFRAAASFSGLVNTTRFTTGIQNIVKGQGLNPLDLWGDPTAQAGLWRQHNAYELISRLPRGFPVYVSSGNGLPGPFDPPDRTPDSLEATLDLMAGDYIARARSHGLNVTADRYGPGTHSWPYWERALTRALPMLASAIGAT
ncbi:alpha/beta hydrolase family protein [Streptomyces sp. NPDC051662]|uniref:alpha/beta hydrolase n=1 Tax=Streptomyces sp. NPDC051662 TaxID=3154750 RepID=UPI00344240FD